MTGEEAYVILKKKVDGMTVEAIVAFMEAHPEILSDLGLAVTDGQLCAVYDE